MATDAHLVALVREGRASAFEAIYNRHHRAILSFARHMLGGLEEAEDAVQHTFLAAYNDLVSSSKPIQLRAWLFTIARNRCYSILRSRREQPLGELDEPATEGLATQVQRRQDLRDLVGDLRRLPDDQRAALVLSEMDALSHEQIATVLGVPKDKVKALVFQARESLVASRAARETDCSEIREQLANMHGGGLRRANLRRHLRDCVGCREFRQQVDHQRRQLRVVLPVAPTLALKEAVLAATVGGGAAAGISAGGGGAVASSLFKAGMLKSLVGAAVAGVGTAGTIVAVHDFQSAVAPSNGGSHHLAPRASFTPATGMRSTSTDFAAAGRSTRSYAGAFSLPPVATGTTSPFTVVRHPVSKHDSAAVPSPRHRPRAAPSHVAARPRPHASPAPSNQAPNLSPSAFGSGSQDAGGGGRSHDTSPSRASGRGSADQQQGGSGHDGQLSHAVSSGAQGDSSAGSGASGGDQGGSRGGDQGPATASGSGDVQTSGGDPSSTTADPSAGSDQGATAGTTSGGDSGSTSGDQGSTGYGGGTDSAPNGR